MISSRTIISIKQFFDIIIFKNSNLLLGKYNIYNIDSATQDSLIGLLQELQNIETLKRSYCGSALDKEDWDKTRGDWNKEEAIKERFDDLEKCLLLDGYKVENNSLVKIEPTIDGVIAFEDELSNEINKFNLSQKTQIIEKIENSANNFKNSNYNNCLSDARIALEAIVRDESLNESDQPKWGKGLSDLKARNVINGKEEKNIANIYTFISAGSHTPLGFTKEEYARYSRNLCMSACYYLVKKINKINKNTTNTMGFLT
jgi:hypothetical protein